MTYEALGYDMRFLPRSQYGLSSRKLGLLLHLNLALGVQNGFFSAFCLRGALKVVKQRNELLG